MSAFCFPYLANTDNPSWSELISSQNHYKHDTHTCIQMSLIAFVNRQWCILPVQSVEHVPGNIAQIKTNRWHTESLISDN